MASYQPPVDTTAIFNSQSFSASNYSGESDPNKLDFPNAQGVPTMPAVNVSNGINSSLITPTGITNSGAYNFNTTSPNPIRANNASGNTIIASKSSYVVGTDNTILGFEAVNSVGDSRMVNNTCIGRSAGLALLAGADNQASSNTFVGRNAGGGIITGSLNTCFGVNAGAGTTSGNSNTFIGANATSSINVGASTVIGSGAIATASNQVVLGTINETVVVPSGLIQTGATTLTVSQTPQLNTANTFSQQQTYNGINVHNQNLSMAAGFGYNLVSRNFLGNYTAVTGATTIAYSTSQIYYINPTASYVITFPSTVANANVGTTFTLRITNSGVGATITIASPFVNIFVGTSAVPVSTHTIYTSGTSTTFASSGTTAGISGTTLTLSGGTIPTLTVGMKITGGATLTDTYITAVLTATTYTVNRSQTATPTTFTTPSPLTSHTFMLLTTGIVATGGSAGFGWFQQGTV